MTARELVAFIEEHCPDAQRVLVRRPDGAEGHVPAIALASPNNLVLIADPDQEPST
jgi:hypothetical protein